MAPTIYEDDAPPPPAAINYQTARMVRWPNYLAEGIDEITINWPDGDSHFRYHTLYIYGSSGFMTKSMRHRRYEEMRPVICSQIEMWACINQWRGLWMSPVNFPNFSIAVTALGDITSTLADVETPSYMPTLRTRQKVITKRELIKLLDYHTEWDEWTHASRLLYNWGRTS